MDLSILNNEQRAAVESLDGPLLVIAGAGSGKTRVLTYRVANLIEHGVYSNSILTLTFTNKAAAEMRERVCKLVGSEAEGMWVTTFHSCCCKMLRIDGERLGYTRNFTIYDDSDQMKLIADILKAMGMSEKSMPKREMKDRISTAKNKSLNAEKYIESHYSDGEDLTLRVYKQYQKRLQSANALDFDDLLLKTIELFESCPDILEKYQTRFRYVLVDEYQDTNMPQYQIVKLICKNHKNICVVGDDDQSIYGWRGADIRNILDFEKDYPNATVIRLEQNYRSTSCILDAANAVISNNQGRKSKKLWTETRGGEKIEHYTAFSERDEASYIAKKILEGVKEGKSYSDYAILYRMNAQSRVIEGTLMNYGIPHKVYGGTRFYERREIQDIMAYLRLIANPNDDVALMRIINVPRRGIGDKAIEDLKNVADNKGCSLLFAALDSGSLPPKLAQKVGSFADFMAELIALCISMPLSALTTHIVREIKYEEYLKSDDKKGEAESRMENIMELVGNIKEIEMNPPEGVNFNDGAEILAAFLETVTLASDIDAMEDSSNGAVALMTLHSAKGLEFPTVFIAGMEDGIFPSSRAVYNGTRADMEEERRLCYVGITRACKRLFLINARQRTLFGDCKANRPSRFFDEIPQELIKQNVPMEVLQQSWQTSTVAESTYSHYASNQGFGIKRSAYEPKAGPDISKTSMEGKNFEKNMRVRHEKFGLGTVMDISGSGASMTVSINFSTGGVKRFAAMYAPLEKMEE